MGELGTQVDQGAVCQQRHHRDVAVVVLAIGMVQVVTGGADGADGSLVDQE